VRFGAILEGFDSQQLLELGLRCVGLRRRREKKKSGDLRMELRSGHGQGIQDTLNNMERYTIVMLLFVLLDEIQKHYRIYTFFCYCLFLFSFLFLLVVYKQL
jgi:hypothetical protein